MTTTPTKPSVQLILTGEEQQCLLALIDLALKSQGLSVAINAVVLAQKVQNAPPHDDTAKEDEKPHVPPPGLHPAAG